MAGEWVTPIASCDACGASWAMPRDEPHACCVEAARAERDRYRKALQQIVALQRPSRSGGLERARALARVALDGRPGPTSCDGCGDADPAHWREGGWYCEGCAACEVCQSPYCDNPEHRP